MSLLARLIEAGTPADLIEEVAMMIAEKRAAEKAVNDRKDAEAARSERYRRSGGGQIEPALRRLVLERDGYACRDCGAEDDLCCDHIIPVSKGGSSEAENLQVLCKPCNSKKKDRIRKRDERRLSENIQGQNRTSKPVQSPGFSAPPNDIYSNPPHLSPSSKTGAKKGSRLPLAWQPKPLPADLAATVAKWADGEVAKQLAMFRDWAASAPGSKGVKSDWDAAWRNWLRRVDGERPRNNSPPRQAPSNSNTLKLTREKLHGTGY